MQTVKRTDKQRTVNNRLRVCGMAKGAICIRPERCLGVSLFEFPSRSSQQCHSEPPADGSDDAPKPQL